MKPRTLLTSCSHSATLSPSSMSSSSGHSAAGNRPSAGAAFTITRCFIHSVPCAAAASTPSTTATIPSQLCQGERARAVESLMLDIPATLPRSGRLVIRDAPQPGAVWLRPWTANFGMRAAEGELYEYACPRRHYDLRNILENARYEKRQAAEGLSREERCEPGERAGPDPTDGSRLFMGSPGMGAPGDEEREAEAP